MENETIVRRPLSQLRRWDGNYRVGNIDAIVSSIVHFGFNGALRVWREGVVMAGNHALIALEVMRANGAKAPKGILEESGEWLVPCVDVAHLSRTEATAFAICDNRTQELGSNDPERLGGLLSELRESGELNSTGYSQTDLDILLRQVARKQGPADLPEARVDLGEELRETWGVERGQVWQIGDHRICCGDSTSPNDVGRLIDGAVDVVVTSPPYAQQRSYTVGEFDWDKLMVGAFDAAPTDESTQILVNLGVVHVDGEWWPYWDGWIEWMRAQGWRRFGFYVWDQGSGLPGDWGGRLAPSHEFVFHFNRRSRKPNKIVETKEESRKPRVQRGTLRDRDGTVPTSSSPHLYGQEYKIPDSVIRITRESSRGIHTDCHPAVFPPAFAAFMIDTFAPCRGTVYEPFAGSGTTFVAAEKTQRRCFGIDIEPSYVAVTLQRLADMGLVPKLL